MEELRRALDEWWIGTNSAFLTRYWHTATEALRKVAADPEGITEFEDNELGEKYVAAVVENHLEHHHYAGVLLTYALFDEFMLVLTERLGEANDAPITPNELRDRGVRRYKKFIHKVCRVAEEEAKIDWQFLHDFSTVRNSIIHANGNKSHLHNPTELEQVVERRSPSLSFKHSGVRLVVSEDYVIDCVVAVRQTALTVHDLAKAEIGEGEVP